MRVNYRYSQSMRATQFLAGATRAQCDACAEKEERSVQVICFISSAVACWRRLYRAENSEAATRERCAPDAARHGGEIVPPSTNSLSIATATASAGARVSAKGSACNDLRSGTVLTHVTREVACMRARTFAPIERRRALLTTPTNILLIPCAECQ